MRHVATIVLVASLALTAVTEASGIAAGAAVLMSTTGLVQGAVRRGGALFTTPSFQVSSGGTTGRGIARVDGPGRL